MPDKGRAIFIVDPEKYLCKESDQDWAIVVKRLPAKVKFIFAQRPEDEIAGSEVFAGLDNVVLIPEGGLGPFDEATVDELLEASGAGENAQEREEIKERTRGSDRAPYTVGGALRVLAGSGIGVEELAGYLTEEEIVKAEWRGICDKGDEARRLFEAYAVLEVGVPGDVVEAVGGVGATARKRLEKDRFLKGLLREEEGGKRIYHAILGDFVLGQIGEDEREGYHSRAVGAYRGKLAQAKKEQSRPDELAAVRLAEHVLAAEGEEAFVEAFVNECYGPLARLGLLDAAIGLSERGLGVVEKGTGREAVLLGNLGVIYRRRGELDKAEEMFRKSLEIAKKIGRQEGMAREYGNLGLIYMDRGDLDKAEEMHLKSSEIEKKLGRQEGMASDYGNLGLIYEERGDKLKARAFWEKALGLYKRIGMGHMVERVEGWIRGLS